MWVSASLVEVPQVSLLERPKGFSLRTILATVQ